MALQDEILKALASGFGMGGIPLYNQETPTNMMTGQPFFRPNAPTSGDIGVKPNLSKQISPALAVSQAISGLVGNINNQPQFNSRDAMNSYNYTPASRNQGEGIEEYVKRLISAPTGAGQLSGDFMQAWSQANKSLPKNNEEPVADKVVSDGGGNGVGTRKDVETPAIPNTDIDYWGVAGNYPATQTNETKTLPYSNSLETKETDTFPYANNGRIGRYELMRLLMRK